MSKAYRAALAALLVTVAMPAPAAVYVVASNVDLTAGPANILLPGGNSFTFTYAPTEFFDFDPVLFQTGGSAAATAFGGFLGIPLEPSTFFTSSFVQIGPSTFPSFASFPTATEVPFSISDGDLGLRFTVGGDDFYGYARFGGSLLQTVAFESAPNTPIQTGAVPEPASWAMMIGGFALVGGALRRRRSAVAFAA